MTTLLRALTVLLLAGSVACATTKAPVEATSTIEVIEEGNGGEAPSTLVEYEAPEGFKVKLPPSDQEPKRETVPLPQGGEAKVAAWAVRDPSGVLYSIWLADYPTELVSKTSPENFLNEGRDGVLQQLQNAQIVSENPITLQGFPGREYTLTSDNGDVKGRNFLVGNRLYTQIYIYNSAVGAPEGDAFLNSLELVNPPAPTPAPESAPAAEPMDGATPAK